MILDFHLRGEQAILEEDHPELAEKAKRYLGFELYYEMSKFNKKPMTEDMQEFKILMTKS